MPTHSARHSSYDELITLKRLSHVSPHSYHDLIWWGKMDRRHKQISLKLKGLIKLYNKVICIMGSWYSMTFISKNSKSENSIPSLQFRCAWHGQCQNWGFHQRSKTLNLKLFNMSITIQHAYNISKVAINFNRSQCCSYSLHQHSQTCLHEQLSTAMSEQLMYPDLHLEWWRLQLTVQLLYK